MPSSACKKNALDRKSTRLNSSHTIISDAVFCLKKKQTPAVVHDPPLLAYDGHLESGVLVAPPPRARVRELWTAEAGALASRLGYLVCFVALASPLDAAIDPAAGFYA